MPPSQPDTDELLRLASQGDRDAPGRLLDRHRDRLRKMVACRLDRRLAPRVDPSDVVQEVLAEAKPASGTTRPSRGWTWTRPRMRSCAASGPRPRPCWVSKMAKKWPALVRLESPAGHEEETAGAF
jgi:hypothetical protein